MGLFDTVVIEGLKLKQPPELKKYLKDNNAPFPSEYQTKDLDPFLTTYKIKENGQVYKQERKPTGKKVARDLPLKGFKDNRSFIERLYWNYKFKEDKTPKLVDEYKSIFVKDKFTNTISIFSLEEIGGRYVTLDYSLKIVDGIVKSHSLIQFELESVKEAEARHVENKAFKDKMDLRFAERNQFTSKWYYPILKEIYNPIVFFGKRATQFICNKIVTWTYRWNGI